MTEHYASASDLLDDATDETRDVDLPNGRRVKVRGLTRFELLMTGKGTEDTALIERRNIALCMVEPPMTEKQVEAWQKSSRPDVFAAITVAIRDLSGLGEGANKSDVAEVRD
jgi:hypothetical protein